MTDEMKQAEKDIREQLADLSPSVSTRMEHILYRVAIEKQCSLTAANKRVEELEKEVAKLREEPACDNTCVMIEERLTAENKSLASSIRERAAKEVREWRFVIVSQEDSTEDRMVEQIVRDTLNNVAEHILQMEIR